MVVDDRWLLMGSANFDRRSFRLNFEFNLEAYDIELAQRLGRGIDGIVNNLRPLTLQEMDERPMWQRFRDGCVRLFSPYLCASRAYQTRCSGGAWPGRCAAHEGRRYI
jgi:cardiolipin synthase